MISTFSKTQIPLHLNFLRINLPQFDVLPYCSSYIFKISLVFFMSFTIKKLFRKQFKKATFKSYKHSHCSIVVNKEITVKLMYIEVFVLQHVTLVLFEVVAVVVSFTNK